MPTITASSALARNVKFSIDVDGYFRNHLIGGDGAFVMVAQDYIDFTKTMIEKLDREIRSIPLAEKRDPGRERAGLAAQMLGEARQRVDEGVEDLVPLVVVDVGGRR